MPRIAAASAFIGVRRRSLARRTSLTTLVARATAE
jgi:hypothetical protein